ncbi:MAG: RnfABCDGE type electron transport complex subunit B [Clostridiaceae bacterium]|nr:RnfABCDGE type electron transport complex subunit B [Clostridiaceae bacterium]
MIQIIIPVAVISGLGLVFGLALSYTSKKFAVEADQRIEQISGVLPGANCGACGYSGCEQYAEAIVEGAEISKCPVGGADAIAQISDIMGVQATTGEKKVARVMCNGTWDKVLIKFDYDGIIDCRSAATMAGGPSSCIYGCVGMGSCMKVCPFGAISVENGLARINEAKCNACGKCVAECPKMIIRLVPACSEYSVVCSNHEKGAVARKNCQVACIGCQKCVKTCPVEAITMDNLCAVIDPVKCENCGKCIEVCPTKAISKYTAHH